MNGLITKFSKTYEFCNGDINKCVLSLRKGVYPYEYMDNWNDLLKHHCLIKKSFHSELNLEGISDNDYIHAQYIFEEFK